MEEQLRALLMGDAQLSALVPGPIDWGARLQGSALPAVVMNVISDIPGYTQQGEDGLTATRVQIDVYALTYGDARIAGRRIRSILSGYSGGIFDSIFLDGARDGREAGTNDAERYFRVSLDFMVNHTS